MAATLYLQATRPPPAQTVHHTEGIFHKCLMSLGTTDALKMCCSFNFLAVPLCFSSLAQPISPNVSQHVLKGDVQTEPCGSTL